VLLCTFVFLFVINEHLDYKAMNKKYLRVHFWSLVYISAWAMTLIVPASSLGNTKEKTDTIPTSGKSYSFKSNPHYFERMKLFAVQKEQKDIVMLGNSLTEGGQWDSILQRTDVANRGIGSDVTEGYINRISDVFDLKPKICFVEGGVNDLARHIPKKTIINNLTILIDTLRSKNITPVLNAVTYVADNYSWLKPKAFNRSIKNLNRAISALAKKKKVQRIDLNTKITDGSFLLKKYAVADGIHYTAETYTLWKMEIMKILNHQ